MLGYNERWHAGPSGDMTLSVVSAAGEQILKVDMLAQGTMKAGLDGERLARALNDMSLVAALPELLRSGKLPKPPHPDAGLSPFPWLMERNERRISLRDAGGRRIGTRTFPQSIPAERVETILSCLETGLKLVHGMAWTPQATDNW